MNERPPNTTGLQISIILIAILAMALGVTAYLLYQENQELKQQLEQQKLPQARLISNPAYELVSLREQRASGRLNPDAFLLVSRSERYNRI